jgi:hypothetical protein
VKIVYESEHGDYLGVSAQFLEEFESKESNPNFDVENIVRGLTLYGQEIKEFTLEEFEEAMNSLNKMEVQAISSNYLSPAAHVGKLLRLSEKVRQETGERRARIAK